MTFDLSRAVGICERQPGMIDQVLAEHARRAGISGAVELGSFLRGLEDELVSRFATPDGSAADGGFSAGARELLDTLEAWQDDPAGALVELAA